MKCKHCKVAIKKFGKGSMFIATERPLTLYCQNTIQLQRLHEPEEPVAAALEINIEQGNISANSGSVWPTCESRPAAPAVEPQKICIRCNQDAATRNCHQCGAPLCDHICEEWHIEKDCKPKAGSTRQEMPPAKAIVDQIMRLLVAALKMRELPRAADDLPLLRPAMEMAVSEVLGAASVQQEPPRELVAELFDCISRLLSAWRTCPLCMRGMPGNHSPECEYLELRDKVNTSAAPRTQGREDWRKLSVTAIAAENLSVAEYIEQLETAQARTQPTPKCPSRIELIEFLVERGVGHVVTAPMLADDLLSVFFTALPEAQPTNHLTKQAENTASLDMAGMCDQTQGPSCHCCGAIMVRNTTPLLALKAPRAEWYCLSCGATTGCS